MRFHFKSDELRQLFQTGACEKLRLHPDLIRTFFKVMQFIAAAPDERLLRNIRSLRMEQLRGNRRGQYSVRLNDQFRLIFTIETDEDGKLLVIIEIVDYH